MVHAFQYLGMPRAVLTDNMKSVVLHRDLEGHPVWRKDYEAFMKPLGFGIKLCKPRHPFTKDKVERLVRFYLCPERQISFDGFVNYEGRRFGVPYSYPGATARVERIGDMLYLYSADLKMLLCTRDVTWDPQGQLLRGPI